MTGTPVADRARISFLGRRNAGKSSLVNAIASQNVSIVSPAPGTTTDPVTKAMEILPLGPCLLTDTAGLDDIGELGALRIEKTRAILAATDVAVLAVPCGERYSREDEAVLSECRSRKIAVVVARTKYDAAPEGFAPAKDETVVSSLTGEGVETLRARIASAMPQEPERGLFDGLVSSGDIVLCVCPIDAAAPKGRLILPQQQAIRELLDRGATAVVCRPGELKSTVSRLGEANVKLAVTDSQAFADVDAALPERIPLTSFSILFARKKGDLAAFCAGAEKMARLKDGDLVLVSEGCTHRRQCGDIGTVKIPRAVEKVSGAKLRFKFSSGADFPLDHGEKPASEARSNENLTPEVHCNNKPASEVHGDDKPTSEVHGSEKPALVVHCGGCMLSRRVVTDRIERCAASGVPVVNYGVALARACGIIADPATCLVRRRIHGHLV